MALYVYVDPPITWSHMLFSLKGKDEGGKSKPFKHFPFHSQVPPKHRDWYSNITSNLKLKDFKFDFS